MSAVPLDGKVAGGDMSTEVKIKAEKDEIPIKHCDKNDEDTEKENAGIDGDKAALHTKLLEQCQQELNTVKEKLVKTERQLEKANAYNEDLRGELDKLSSELHSLKRAARENRTDAETQTDDQQDISTERDGLSQDQAIVIDDSINEGNEDRTDGDDKKIDGTKTQESAETENGARTDKSSKVEEISSTENDTKTEDDNKMEHDAQVEKEAKEGEEQVSSTSLADELRATAEAAVQQTGYVYDENTGLYYDYNSGYYYNAEKALYYDPNTGTYFYYNSETGKYEFHSKVDLSQYSTGHGQDSQQYNNYYGQWQDQDHHSSDRGDNYDLPRKDYHNHSSHRHNDSGYDQYHRPLRRRDRETSRSSKSYIEYDHHRSSQRRDKEGSSRIDSDKKKKTKRLQTEEMDKEEYEEVISALEGLRIKTAKETALELVSKWPPCIRVIVTDSDTIDPGNLFIITCTGATVGREKEMGHTILIPDINVSKAHAEIQFDEKEYKYYLTDLASQNGTFLNEERVSEPKVKSKPMVLGHGDILQFGCTRLLLHIHDGTDTCDECEPGQVQAQLQAQLQAHNQPQKEIVILSKEEKLRQQRQELKKIKKKYGLKNSAYVDNMGAINNPAYNDKADERRKTVGSDNPYQPDEAPASVHRPISEGNKGHKMLKKLGWTEGESLGKDNEGIRQPISVKFRANKSAGLGSGGAGEGSVQEVGYLNRRQKWMDVQQRYNKIDQDSVESGSGRDKKTLTTPKWVQGETQES